MYTYSVTFFRDWNYMVEAEDYIAAQEKAFELFKQDEGEDACIDDVRIARMDENANWV